MVITPPQKKKKWRVLIQNCICFQGGYVGNPMKLFARTNWPCRWWEIMQFTFKISKSHWRSLETRCELQSLGKNALIVFRRFLYIGWTNRAKIITGDLYRAANSSWFRRRFPENEPIFSCSDDQICPSSWFWTGFFLLHWMQFQISSWLLCWIFLIARCKCWQLCLYGIVLENSDVPFSIFLLITRVYISFN